MTLTELSHATGMKKGTLECLANRGLLMSESNHHPGCGRQRSYSAAYVSLVLELRHFGFPWSVAAEIAAVAFPAVSKETVFVARIGKKYKATLKIPDSRVFLILRSRSSDGIV